MQVGPSPLSLVAAGLYLLVAGAAVTAVWRALVLRQVAWHRWGWAMIAAMFIGFALMRVFAIEEILRSDLRMALYFDDVYETRRSLQGPLFAIIFIIAAAMAASLVYFVASGVKGRRNGAALVAIGCTGGMFFLAALRLVSLHSVDALLYGPMKLNWIADLGLSLCVLASALRYRMVVRPAPA